MEKKKATVLKSAFAEAAGAAKGLSSRDALSVFGKVRLDVAGGHMSLAATDGIVAVTRRIECEHDGDFSAAVPGLTLERFASLLPEGKTELAPERNGTRLILSAPGLCKFAMSAEDASAAPMLAGPDEKSAKIFIGGMQLREMLRKVRHAAALPGSGRKALEGVYMELKDGRLAMTATDGRRLAHVEFGGVSMEEGPDAFGVILPTKATDVLSKMLAGCEEEITVMADAKGVSFTSNHWHMVSKVTDETYPQWKQVVPENLPHEAKLDRVMFLNALEQAAAAEDESQGVKIRLEHGRAALSAKNNVSRAEAETCGCTIADGAKLEMAANPRLFRDALTCVDDDMVTLGFGDDLGPVTLKCSIPWVEVVMPYREV